MTAGERVRKIREKKDISANELSRLTGISQSTISKLENGKRKADFDLLDLLARGLKVSIDTLIGESATSIIDDRLEEIGMSLEAVSEKAGVSFQWLQNLDDFIPGKDDVEDHELDWDAVIGEYKSYEWITRVAKVIGLPAAQLRAALARQEIPLYEGPQETLEEFKQALADSDSRMIEFDSEYLRRIPLVGKVAAGNPALAIENTNDYIVIDTRINKINSNQIGDYFALEIVGQSMEPTVHAGEVVLVKKTPIIELGEIGVFRCNSDEATIKRLAREGGKVYLVPDNKQFPVQEYSKECECIGKVLESIRRTIK